MIKKIQGYLVQVVHDQDRYLLALATANDEELLVLPVTTTHYQQLFPAGEPALDDPYEITLSFDQQQVNYSVSFQFN